MSTAIQEVLGEVTRPVFELVIGGAGQLATGEVAEVSNETPTYEYRLLYDDEGNIAGAHSRRTNPANGEIVGTDFDADGVPTHKDETYKNGDLRVTTWYEKGYPTRQIVVDKAANTHTMAIFQPGIGDWVCTTQYEGQDGWVGSAPTDIDF